MSWLGDWGEGHAARMEHDFFNPTREATVLDRMSAIVRQSLEESPAPAKLVVPRNLMNDMLADPQWRAYAERHCVVAELHHG